MNAPTIRPRRPVADKLPPDDQPHLTAHERATPMMDARTGPLTDVRVLDLTQAIAGPWSTMMLADLGADVIKIEAPRGDMQRNLPPYTLDDEVKAYGGSFAQYNRNKRGVIIDLATDEGREQLLRLVESADAIVENMRAGVMDELGLGYETINERNPSIVYGAIRGFGDPRTGESPYARWPAYDVIAQAHGGLVSMNGSGPDERVQVGPFLGDIYPGTVGALAFLAAIYHAKRTGEGQFVDVAMTDSIMAITEQGVMRLQLHGAGRHTTERQQQRLRGPVRRLRDHRRRGGHRITNQHPLEVSRSPDRAAGSGRRRAERHPTQSGQEPGADRFDTGRMGPGPNERRGDRDAGRQGTGRGRQQARRSVRRRPRQFPRHARGRGPALGPPDRPGQHSDEVHRDRHRRLPPGPDAGRAQRRGAGRGRRSVSRGSGHGPESPSASSFS